MVFAYIFNSWMVGLVCLVGFFWREHSSVSGKALKAAYVLWSRQVIRPNGVAILTTSLIKCGLRIGCSFPSHRCVSFKVGILGTVPIIWSLWCLCQPTILWVAKVMDLCNFSGWVVWSHQGCWCASNTSKYKSHSSPRILQSVDNSNYAVRWDTRK